MLGSLYVSVLSHVRLLFRVPSVGKNPFAVRNRQYVSGPYLMGAFIFGRHSKADDTVTWPFSSCTEKCFCNVCSYAARKLALNAFLNLHSKRSMALIFVPSFICCRFPQCCVEYCNEVSRIFVFSNILLGL